MAHRVLKPWSLAAPSWYGESHHSFDASHRVQPNARGRCSDALGVPVQCTQGPLTRRTALTAARGPGAALAAACPHAGVLGIAVA
eukprot:scaffold69718_cov27-Tisochrysis_lutea.AAC.1